MKTKLLTIVISGLIFCSCSNQEMDSMINHVEQCDSFYVPYDEALDKAEAFLSLNGIETRASIRRSVLTHSEIKIDACRTRSAGDEPEVRFHLINFTDNKGYALVSADSRTTAVYAYSPTGNLNYNDAVENTGFGVFMESAIDYYIDEIDKFSSVTPPPFDPIIRDTCEIAHLPIIENNGERYYVRHGNLQLDNYVNPMVNVEWAQLWPYNCKCPEYWDNGLLYGYRSPAGCGPVAAGQIMSYYQRPSSYDGESFSWTLINSSVSFHESYSTGIPASNAAQAVAKLLYKIGADADAIYAASTSTTISRIKNTFSHFGYSANGPSSFSSSRVTSSLEAGCPVYISGRMNGEERGHAWVIDGYQNFKYLVTYYHLLHPHPVYRSEYYYNRDNYYHCNWGYDGDDNGFYLDTFNGRNQDMKIIYNIQ